MVDWLELTELPDDFRRWKSPIDMSSIVSAIFGAFGKTLHVAGESLLNVRSGASWSGYSRSGSVLDRESGGVRFHLMSLLLFSIFWSKRLKMKNSSFKFHLISMPENFSVRRTKAAVCIESSWLNLKATKVRKFQVYRSKTYRSNFLYFFASNLFDLRMNATDWKFERKPKFLSFSSGFELHKNSHKILLLETFMKCLFPWEMQYYFDFVLTFHSSFQFQHSRKEFLLI